MCNLTNKQPMDFRQALKGNIARKLNNRWKVYTSLLTYLLTYLVSFFSEISPNFIQSFTSVYFRETFFTNSHGQ